MKRRTTTVSGDYVHGSFDLLERSGDRARAALHFCQELGLKAHEGKVQLARWYLRAALSEFRSIFELLNDDFRKLGVGAQWKRSKEAAYLESDPIIGVLRKVRDFAVHSGKIAGKSKAFGIIPNDYPESSPSIMVGLVIEPLDRKTLAKDRGKDELRAFDDAALDAFNATSRNWPADLLVHLAIYQASKQIAAFLAPHLRKVLPPKPA